LVVVVAIAVVAAAVARWQGFICSS